MIEAEMRYSIYTQTLRNYEDNHGNFYCYTITDAGPQVVIYNNDCRFYSCSYNFFRGVWDFCFGFWLDWWNFFIIH